MSDLREALKDAMKVKVAEYPDATPPVTTYRIPSDNAIDAILDAFLGSLPDIERGEPKDEISQLRYKEKVVTKLLSARSNTEEKNDNPKPYIPDIPNGYDQALGGNWL